MGIRVSIDVDLTIVDENEDLLPGVSEGLSRLKAKGYELTLWSSTGAERAERLAKKYKLTPFFDGYATKPDLAVDDDFDTISHLPVIDVRFSAGRLRRWSDIAESTIKLAEEIDSRSLWPSVPNWIQKLADDKFDMGVQCSMGIWNQRETFIRWPATSRLLWPGLKRHTDGRRKDCYEYPESLKTEITGAGYQVDARNNGPAIHAFQLADGDRPLRPYPESWGWTIHHIYDGKHPTPASVSRKRVPHAVFDGTMFTHSAGLVAVHPLADYVATNEPLLAWLLRWEAYRRFGYDPMLIFDETDLIPRQQAPRNR